MSTILGKDEKMMKEATFTANLILFWLKANYALTNKRITGQAPNTFLGVIPFGAAQIAQPLKTVASVSSSTDFYFKRLIVGLIFLVIGYQLLSAVFIIGVIVMILGLIKILNCYTASFVITNNAGEQQWSEISILEKDKLQAFVNEINTVTAEL